MVRLSLSLLNSNSANVEDSIAINAKRKIISLKKDMIIKEEIKKEIAPSKVLFLILITPNFRPTIAARLSEILIISRDIIANSLLKSKIIIVEDIKT